MFFVLGTFRMVVFSGGRRIFEFFLCFMMGRFIFFCLCLVDNFCLFFGFEFGFLVVKDWVVLLRCFRLVEWWWWCCCCKCCFWLVGFFMGAVFVGFGGGSWGTVVVVEVVAVVVDWLLLVAFVLLWIWRCRYRVSYCVNCFL